MEKITTTQTDNLCLCLFTSKDYAAVQKLDELSGNDVSCWVDESELYDGEVSDYAFGVVYGDELVGYCTICYAEGASSVIEDDSRYNVDSFLLSDVYVIPQYRNKGVGRFLVSEAMKYKLTEELNAPNICIQLLDDDLSSFYTGVGFKWLNDTHEYVMIADREDILHSEVK